MRSDSLTISSSHLIRIRWMTLANALVLLFFWGNPLALFVLCIVAIYNLAITITWPRLVGMIQRFPVLIFIDLTITNVAIWLTGGDWQSPYFPYSILSLMIATFFFGIKRSLLALLYFWCLYTIGILLNQQVFSELAKHNYAVLLFSNYLGVCLVTLFFAYPANIVRSISLTENEIAETKKQLVCAKGFINTIRDSDELSCRELQILQKLSEGKSNKLIASELHLSENTIRNHLYRTYKKISVSSRTEAVIYFHSRTTASK